MNDIIFEYYQKWEEYFEEIEESHRWEAMALLLADELKRERFISQSVKRTYKTEKE